MHVTAIVLAAGFGRRMGQDKALLDLAGRSSIQRVVDACSEGGVDSITVVRGASDARRQVSTPGLERGTSRLDAAPSRVLVRICSSTVRAPVWAGPVEGAAPN